MSYLSRKLREREFLDLTRELLDSDQVRMMGRWKPGYHFGSLPVRGLQHLPDRPQAPSGCARCRPGGPAPRPVSLRFQGQVSPPGEPVLRPSPVRGPERRRPYPPQPQGEEHHPLPYVALGGRSAPVFGSVDGGPGRHHLRRLGGLADLPALPPAGAAGSAPPAAHLLTERYGPPSLTIRGAVFVGFGICMMKDLQSETF